MTTIQRIPPRREPIALYDDEADDYIYPGTYHVVVAVEALGTDGKMASTSASLRDGLLEEDARHEETVYSRLEQHLRAMMVQAGVWSDD